VATMNLGGLLAACGELKPKLSRGNLTMESCLAQATDTHTHTIGLIVSPIGRADRPNCGRFGLWAAPSTIGHELGQALGEGRPSLSAMRLAAPLRARQKRLDERDLRKKVRRKEEQLPVAE